MSDLGVLPRHRSVPPDSGCRVEGRGLRVESLGFRVAVVGVWVQGLEFPEKFGFITTVGGWLP